MSALVALASLAAGCSGSLGFTKGVSYAASARANYLKGMAELEDEAYEEAHKYFAFVKNKFPFSAYATMAELRVADTYFAEDKFVEAIDAYRQFKKLHPTHPEVENGYVSYRICEANVKQIPSDWFLIPPSHEKDQSSTREAIRELVVFKKEYPRSKYLSKANELHRRCIRHIADHELYVARFYLDRDKPMAAILRLEALLLRYPDAGVDPEVMLLLGKTYMKMDKKDKARSTFVRLVKNYPKDPYSEKARLYIQFLDGAR